MHNYNKPNLTKYPPRSPRTRLGGFAHLPRLIDKARAHVAGTCGEYHYDCGMDQHFWRFTGIKAKDFIKPVRARKSDSELLAYVLKNMKPRRAQSEINAWSSWFENRAPGGVEGREVFQKYHQGSGPKRDDISTWFEMLELDDYVSFGGKP
jgi:hypothetical protein